MYKLDSIWKLVWFMAQSYGPVVTEDDVSFCGHNCSSDTAKGVLLHGARETAVEAASCSQCCLMDLPGPAMIVEGHSMNWEGAFLDWLGEGRKCVRRGRAVSLTCIGMLTPLEGPDTLSFSHWVYASYTAGTGPRISRGNWRAYRGVRESIFPCLFQASQLSHPLP